MKSKTSVLVICAALTLFVGCNKLFVKEPIVKYEDVLIYNRPFDFTYYGVIEAIDNSKPWELASTDKEAGTIQTYNSQYWDAFDADKRYITILLKRISRRKTAVELAPESQTVIGAGEILKKIDLVLGRYRE